MQVESRKNKNAKRLHSVRGTQRFTKHSQTNGGANIRINSETTIPKLKNLAKKYIGVSNPYGFLTDLQNALGIPNSKGASKYGVVTIPKEDGRVLEASLRITNHNSDAETYISHNANYEYNLSILIRKNFKPNTFKPHDDVVLDEFVYYGKRMQRVENPLTQIINSIIRFLQSGVYNDTTGIAFKNQSPQPNTENKQNLNCNTNMNKKLIRLTESDLHRIVKESVKRVLKESLDSSVIPSDFFRNPFQYNNIIDLGSHKLGYSGFSSFATKNSVKYEFVLTIYLPNGEDHYKQQILDLNEAENWTDDKTYRLYVILCKMYGIQPAKMR